MRSDLEQGKGVRNGRVNQKSERDPLSVKETSMEKGPRPYDQRMAACGGIRLFYVAAKDVMNSWLDGAAAGLNVVEEEDHGGRKRNGKVKRGAWSEIGIVTGKQKLAGSELSGDKNGVAHRNGDNREMAEEMVVDRNGGLESSPERMTGKGWW